jgi:GNAT superfamily N-acetyltransferase
MTGSDADRVAALSGELGYPATPEQIRTRLRAIEANPESRALVATDTEGRIRGWVHVYGRRHVESDGSAEIGGLVVEPGLRGQGIGRSLMEAAESWARERGFGRVTLGSSTVRAETHRFYERLGYSIVKSQYRFQKPLLEP